MLKLTYLIYALLALAGCNQAERTMTNRATENGVDQLYTKVRVHGGTASFACIVSASGHCYFAVFDCDMAPCSDRPIREIAVAAGSEEALGDLPANIQLCTSQVTTPQTSACVHPGRSKA